jgi:uncharacterized protein YraI
MLCFLGCTPEQEAPMNAPFASLAPNRLPAFLCALLLLLTLAIPPAQAQVSGQAEPVTGPGVTTIGNIAAGARVNVRSGPSALFPVVGTLGYGTRVEKGLCIGGGSARWCEVETMDGTLAGYVSGRFLVEGGDQPTDDDLVGGPDYWQVVGLASNERLGVRLEPRSGSTVLATLTNREIVRNLGCRMSGSQRWCRIRSITGMDVTGWVSARYLRESGGPVQPPAGGDAGGPDFYVVQGLTAGDTLNVRTRPSTRGDVIARLSQGTRVRNLGCEVIGQSRWCRIRTTGAGAVTGWVNGRYLRESGGPVQPPAGGDDGGPDFYVVRGLTAGDTLNVRSQPSTRGDVIARLSQGTRVRNLGCEVIGQSRWCRIRTTGTVAVTGWVNGRYLREG